MRESGSRCVARTGEEEKRTRSRQACRLKMKVRWGERRESEREIGRERGRKREKQRQRQNRQTGRGGEMSEGNRQMARNKERINN